MGTYSRRGSGTSRSGSTSTDGSREGIPLNVAGCLLCGRRRLCASREAVLLAANSLSSRRHVNGPCPSTAFAGDPRALGHRCELQIRDVRIDRPEARESAEAAVAAGDHALAADQSANRQIRSATSSRMLDVVRRRADHAGNQDLVFGDLLRPGTRSIRARDADWRASNSRPAALPCAITGQQQSPSARRGDAAPRSCPSRRACARARRECCAARVQHLDVLCGERLGTPRRCGCGTSCGGPCRDPARRSAAGSRPPTIASYSARIASATASR